MLDDDDDKRSSAMSLQLINRQGRYCSLESLCDFAARDLYTNAGSSIIYFIRLPKAFIENDFADKRVASIE